MDRPDQVRHLLDLVVASIEGRGDETFIDATCEPPESYTFAGMVAHVLTFAAYRRTLAAGGLLDAGVTDVGIGNPIGFGAGGGVSGSRHWVMTVLGGARIGSA